jgi:hypothetical protein
MRPYLSVTAVFLIGTADIFAADLANPAVTIPAARLAVGASYNLGGYSISNRAVPSLLNRIEARVSYSPFSFLNFGIDGGASQMEVAADTTATDSIGTFHGDYGFSGGAHLKLGTPFFFKDLVSIIGIVRGSLFSSKNDAGTTYGGTDIAGAAGLQFHIQGIGYITAGSEVYLIFGKSTDYLGVSRVYSNVNNVRGWLAVDFFPTQMLNSKNLFYISLEMSVSPKVRFNDRAPVEEFGFSVSAGVITPRLYGQQSEIDWKP